MTAGRRAKVKLPKHKSTSVPEPVDPRVEKTHAQIAEAFIQLLHLRPYYRIRVSDVTRRAKVGRATFYAHFESKDALLQERFAAVVGRFVRRLSSEAGVLDCTAFFAHVLSGRQIYRSLTAGPGRALTERLLQDVLEARFAELLGTKTTTVSNVAHVPGFVPRFIAGTALSLIAWGLEQDPPPTAEDLQSAFNVLVGRAIRPNGD
jgi:AcrR family transcriptional regulator